MSKLTLLLLAVALMVVVTLADEQQPQYSNSGKKYDGFYEYVNAPGINEYEFGFNRGNQGHYVSRFEQFKDARFRTKVKWADEEGSYGEQIWEYNHAPSAAYPAPAYPSPAYPASAPAYPEPEYPSAPAYPEPPAYRAGPVGPFAASAPNPSAVRPNRPAANKPAPKA